jgi:hypothetical protein
MQNDEFLEKQRIIKRVCSRKKKSFLMIVQQYVSKRLYPHAFWDPCPTLTTCEEASPSFPVKTTRLREMKNRP